MLWFLFSVIVGVIIADIATGVVHYIEDNMKLTGIKWFDDAIIIPNQQHHEKPMEFLKNGWWERNNTTIIASSIVALPFLLIFGSSVILITAWLFSSMANQIHYWSHTPKPPKLISWLQSKRLLLSKKDHWSHHVPPYNRSFCTITSLLNPIYNRLKR